MENIEKSIGDCIYYNPLPLLNITNERILSSINSCLPYSVGIEIECSKKPNFKDELFTSIPNIIEVNCDNGEQRYRIPSGFKGMICLFEITKNLKLYSELNPLSGIHYHIDCTNFYDSIVRVIHENKEWILEELSTWNYKGNYNHKGISSFGAYWLRSQDIFKTLEFRIGEMTFDYPLMIKRIMHASKIVNKLSIIADVNSKRSKELKIQELVNDLIPKELNISLEQAKFLISNRVKKIIRKNE